MKRGEELLANIRTNIVRKLMKEECVALNERQATQIAKYSCEAVCEEIGGRKEYLPRTPEASPEIRRVYAEIYDQFDGTNSRRLAVMHGYSERHVRRIIETERQRRRAEKLTKLPPQQLASGDSE